jgi:hypothetical protein
MLEMELQIAGYQWISGANYSIITWLYQVNLCFLVKPFYFVKLFKSFYEIYIHWNSIDLPAFDFV